MSNHLVCLRFCTLLLTLATASRAIADTPPDAGQMLQQDGTKLQLPREAPVLDIQPPYGAKLQPGGAKVKLSAVQFTGNTVFNSEQLSSILNDVIDNSYYLSGLISIAQRVSEYYRVHGYPFARAYLPAQQLDDGILKLTIVEGSYGSVGTSGDEKITRSADKFLAILVPGDIIKTATLERATLILDDLPGVITAPIMRPGQEFGRGDLEVKVQNGELFGGNVGIDNHGNRYTGRTRATLNLFANSRLTLGDQIRFSSIYTEEDTWSGSASYTLPLNGDGLRGTIGYAHTDYVLGKDFSYLDAHGTANVGSLGLSYPLIRSKISNLVLSGIYQHKQLHDLRDATGMDNYKSGDSLLTSLNFDRRDTFGGGGVTYGSLGWAHGSINLDAELSASDRMTARTEGSYDKINIDLARLQALPKQFTLHGRFSAQVSMDNLDSSESFGLGGPNGVRAYPVGEGFGDEGILGQLELRHNKMYANGANLNTFVFYDSGKVIINHSPWSKGENHRSISGAGLGLRAGYQQFSAEAVLAWRTSGGQPQSDTESDQPTMWISADYKF